jgi:gamma-glutamyltranspeptidase/glutathione hydrolase
MLNNMLGEEDLHDHGFHNWQPDSRLSSMMAPTIVEAPDGGVTALGSGGSNRIRSAILQVICNQIDHAMPLAEAVSAPRLHVEKCKTVSYEDTPTATPFTSQAKEALQAVYPDAHNWPQQNMFFGGVHTARRDRNGDVDGMGDPRRNGVAIIVEN